MIACGSTSSSSKSAAAVSLQQLEGTYADPVPYAYGEAFGHRTFVFGDGRWSLDFVLGLDPQLNAQVFRFRTHGEYEILEASREVEGAFNAIFYEEQKLLTLLTDDTQLIAAFGLEPCGLVTDKELDISAEGCAGWRPVAECGGDHDLLMLTSDGGLRFGERPADNDMCTADRRPSSLTPAVERRSQD